MTGFIRQALRFGLVGIANTSIGLMAIYAVLYFFSTNPAIANASGYAIGMVVSFILNRTWTFRDSRSITNVLPRYIFIAAISYLINLAVVLVGTYHFAVGPYLIQLFGIGIYTLAMFLGCRWFVFQTPMQSDASLKK
jgi:putative flippase GtrA